MKRPSEIYPNFEQWPESWEDLPESLPYGREILELMRPFIVQLIDKGLTRKTIKKHMDNLWLFGGEVIRNVSMDEEYHMPAIQKIRESIDADAEETAYNASCKKSHRFLNSKAT